MAFTTTQFAAQFAGRLMENLQTVIERDTPTALRAIDADLDAPKDYATPISIALNFPAVYLEPDSSRLTQADDDSYITGEHSFVITLSIVGPTPNALKLNVVKYVRALDQVIRTATTDDLTDGVTSSVGPPVWEVTEHRYGLLRAEDRGIYRWDAQLVIVFQLLER